MPIYKRWIKFNLNLIMNFILSTNKLKQRNYSNNLWILLSNSCKGNLLCKKIKRKSKILSNHRKYRKLVWDARLISQNINKKE